MLKTTRREENEPDSPASRFGPPSFPASVILPVNNGELYLAEAIESVLAQSLAPQEIIVIDDGSRDGSAKIAASYGAAVTVHSFPNGGPSVARNRGVRLAQGKFIAFLDADDIWCRRKLERQSQVFSSQPEMEAVFGYVQEFISPELASSEHKKLNPRTEPVAGYLASALLLRRKVFDRVGFFDEEYRAGEFINWMLRAREKALRIAVPPEVVLHRRLHMSNMTRTLRHLGKDYLRVVRDHLKHRRAKTPPKN